MIILHGVTTSASMHFPAEYDFALPDSAMEGIRLPICLLLHDLGKGREQWIYETRLALVSEQYQISFLLPEGRRSCFLNMNMGPNWGSFLQDDLIPAVQQQFGMEHVPVFVIGIGSGALGAMQLAANAGFFCVAIDPDVCSPFQCIKEFWPKEQEWKAVFENKQECWHKECFSSLCGTVIGEKKNIEDFVTVFGLERWKAKVNSGADLEEKLRSALEEYCDSFAAEKDLEKSR